jgi:hypothetical protein
MTIKEYLESDSIKDKNLIGLEFINDTIINLVGDGFYIGLRVDMSNIPSGTHLQFTDDFILNGDILQCGDISININEVYVL